MPVEDIAEVVASSYDARFPPRNIFRQNLKSSDFNSIANGLEGHHSYNNMNSVNSSGEGFLHQVKEGLSASSSGTALNFNHSSIHSPTHHSTGLVVPMAQRKMGSYKDRSSVKGWICSGVVPQFLHVVFFEKGEIKKVTLFSSYLL